ncbi:MAG: hypothetical protein MRY63_06365 [Neomegalonema sp.]|nr:hypothetical protein [Neomegalonema sp.]
MIFAYFDGGGGSRAPIRRVMHASRRVLAELQCAPGEGVIEAPAGLSDDDLRERYAVDADQDPPVLIEPGAA